jgi:hypothetical protein
MVAIYLLASVTLVPFVASSKGRSGLAWMLIALLMSPLLALIALVAVPAGEAGSRSILSTPNRGGENKTLCPFRRAWGRFWPFVRLAGTIPSIVEGNGMEGRSAAPAFSRFLSFFLPNHGIHD